MPGNTLSRIGSLGYFATTRYRARAHSSSRPLLGGYGIIYDVPFCPQLHANMCGDAAATMVVSFGLHRTSGVVRAARRTVARQARPTRGFHKPPGLDDNALCAEYRLEEVILPGGQLGPTLRDNGPLVIRGEICTAEYTGEREGHFAVLKGVWGDDVIIDDPWQGRDRRKSRAWFDEHVQAAFGWRDFVAAPDGKFTAQTLPSEAYLAGRTADLG